MSVSSSAWPCMHVHGGGAARFEMCSISSYCIESSSDIRHDSCKERISCSSVTIPVGTSLPQNVPTRQGVAIEPRSAALFFFGGHHCEVELRRLLFAGYKLVGAL